MLFFGLLCWDYADFFRVAAVTIELHFLGLAEVNGSGDSGVERVIGSAANILTGDNASAALANDDLTGSGGFTVGLFHA